MVNEAFADGAVSSDWKAALRQDSPGISLMKTAPIHQKVKVQQTISTMPLCSLV